MDFDLKAVNSIVKNRKGAVLSRQTILKSDLFHSIAKGDHLQGAKHFRGIHNIYGVSQPTKTGWLTILTLLKENILWVNTREEPLVYINGMPYLLRNEYEPYRKLKFAGIAAERLEQLEYRLKLDILKEIKTNNLLLVHDEINGEIVPCYMAVEHVQTPRELVEHFINQGFDIKYIRLPISPEQGFVEIYVETLINAFMAQNVDDPIVINCGMGASRTTFCMIIALMIRKAKENDDFSPVVGQRSIESLNDLAKETDFQHKSLIRLMKVLEEGLQASAIQFAITRSSLLENLINSVNGNYQIVLELSRVLDKGVHIKKIVDALIDECDQVVNIRDRILFYRIRYFTTKDEVDLYKGKAQLERYYALLVVMSYLVTNPSLSFSVWLKERPEIYSIFPKNTNVDLYRPIHNLSALSTASGSDAEMYCVKNRSGTVLGPNTILKVDFWGKQTSLVSNFRRVPGYPLYGCAQPTIKGLQFILSEIRETFPNQQVTWINVREEPLIYINGLPYVLRDQSSTLRNINTYSGINCERLELMEQRLKVDIVKELQQFGNQILLHNEVNHDIEAKWEDVKQDHIFTPKQIFENINYFRVPITAEGYPEENDFDEILSVLNNNQGVFVVNCQMGVGRSTMVLVVSQMVFNWLHNKTRGNLDKISNINYQSIHGLLRVIKNGLEIKKMVDDVIDNNSQIFNIRDSIEKYRVEAESTNNEKIRAECIAKGVLNLERYFILIVFQSYLDQNAPDAYLIKFGQWLKQHEEILQMFKELSKASIKDLLSIDKILPGDGLALTNEILKVVKSRNGQVLAQNTILKDDCFPGCQKLTLLDRIVGAPNYRRVEYKDLVHAYHDPDSCYGVAMPTFDGIKNTIDRIKGKVYWTSLREEPVIYVLNKPYVLREFHEPLKNLEITGIAKERVELMEYNAKIDLKEELAKYGGRVLLHEEVVTDSGFTINAVWQTITENDILTPLEMFAKIQSLGYQVDYLRIPITDEQAPIPLVFDLLTNRINSANGNDLVFNCQMGRGRTSTGMIIACILKLVRSDYLSEMYKSSTNDNLKIYDDEVEEFHLLRGEYRIILQLMSVLSQGKVAKSIVDTAIDANQHLQNLREAIYTFKCKLRQMDPQTKQYSQLHQVTINYLIRYFFLIVFCDYSLDKSKQSFVDWLKDRREVTNIIRNENQDLS
eukprot:NODE_726_length_4415_cov_0.494556.p1 type:complete len:1175 gc:universal NODE_726_length_4415_cov_0.494556:3709-185(-)